MHNVVKKVITQDQARKSKMHLKNKIQKINRTNTGRGKPKIKTQDLQNLDMNTGSRSDRINGVQETRSIATTTKRTRQAQLTYTDNKQSSHNKCSTRVSIYTQEMNYLHGNSGT